MQIMITGMGAVSAAGNGIDETVTTFASGERHVAASSFLSAELVKPVFCAKNFPAPAPHPAQMRTIDLCMVAAAEAVAMAGFSLDSLKSCRVGVCIGTTVASQLNDISFYRAYKKYGDAKLDAVDRYLQGNISDVIARSLCATGPSLTVGNACSSGSDAIGVALSWLRNDLCDVVIAGGADELNCVPLSGFNSLGILSDSLCAPFDQGRDGLNLGEGAGVFVLESQENAAKRGYSSCLSVAGYGAANDAYHLTAPHPDGRGLRVAIQSALCDAGIETEDISFVNAHGTATPDNDRVEGNVLASLFGSSLNFVSTKGYTGHTLGAAGGLEAVFTALALQKGWIPESVGFESLDDSIGIAPVTARSDVEQTWALSTSLAFGGNNAALVINYMK